MADPNTLPPLPADHLSHPESWATGGDPATGKQMGFIKTLEKQHPDLVPADGLGVGTMGKSEASEVIDRLKKGEKVENGEEALQGKLGAANETEQVKSDEAQAPKKAGAGDDEPMDLAVNVAGHQDDGEKNDVKGDAGSKRKAPSSGKAKRPAEQADDDDEEDSDNLVSGKDLKKTKQMTLDGAVAEGEPQSKKARKAKEAKTEEPAIPEQPAPSSSMEQVESVDPIDRPPTPAPDSDAQMKVPDAAPVTSTTPADGIFTNPADDAHLDHPENWATGGDPATGKQKGFLKVLEKQKGVEVDGAVETMGKSEASEKIDELKNM